MKRRTLIKGAAAVGFSLLSGTGFAAAPKKKILVAYFSRARSISRGMDAITYATPWVGNTAEAARVIAQTLNADVHEIVTTEKYPLLHRENSRIAEQEMKSDARPGIAPSNLSLDSYSVVFLGFPIWWYREPHGDPDISGAAISGKAKRSSPSARRLKWIFLRPEVTS